MHIGVKTRKFSKLLIFFSFKNYIMLTINHIRTILKTLNQNIFLTINADAGQNHLLDVIMSAAAQYTPYIFIAILFYLWFSNKKNEALYAGYATTLGVGINSIIGLFYFHPRPFMDGLGVALLHHKAENSFPSDHTTFVLSIALMLTTFKSTRVLGVVSVLLAIWCGISRVYCGVHYPFDILGSIVVSIIAVIIISILKNKLASLNNFIISIWHKKFNY